MDPQKGWGYLMFSRCRRLSGELSHLRAWGPSSPVLTWPGLQVHAVISRIHIQTTGWGWNESHDQECLWSSTTMVSGFSQVSWLTNNAMHCFYRTVESCILIKSIITKLTDESVYRREAWEEIAHLISTCYEYHNTNSIIFSFHIFFFRKW